MRARLIFCSWLGNREAPPHRGGRRARTSVLFCAGLLSATWCSVSGCNRQTEEQTQVRFSRESLDGACQILSSAEAELVLGAAVQTPTTSRFGGETGPIVSNCSYRSTADPLQGISLLARLADPMENSDDALTRFVAGQQNLFGKKHQLETLTSFANGAVWDPQLKQLALFRGPDMLLLSLEGIESERAKSLLEGLGQTILRKVNPYGIAAVAVELDAESPELEQEPDASEAASQVEE